MKKAIFVFIFELRDTGMNILSTTMSEVVEISFAFFAPVDSNWFSVAEELAN